MYSIHMNILRLRDKHVEHQHKYLLGFRVQKEKKTMSQTKTSIHPRNIIENIPIYLPKNICYEKVTQNKNTKK